MTNAVSVAEISKQHESLYAAFVEAQGALQDAKGRYAEKKAIYCAYHSKYGRVLTLMEEDKKDGHST